MIWGFDTGLIWTTYRLSFISWLLLLMAFAGVAPAWAGAVYGIVFAVPLLALLLVPPRHFPRSAMSSLIPAQVVGVASMIVMVLLRHARWSAVSRTRPSILLAMLAVLMMTSGCSGSEYLPPHSEKPLTRSSTRPCNDVIDASKAVPRPSDAPPNVPMYLGSGDTFFIANPFFQGRQRRWGDDVKFDQGVFGMKIGIYTLDSQPPRISVTRSDGGAVGSASSTPTTRGLPGPLPTSLTFPTPGCWKVEARGSTGFASIEVEVRAPQPSPPR